MKRTQLLRLGGWALLMGLPLMVVSCDDDLSNDSHYKTPDFLAGNALEVLQKDGNYTTFVRGIELIGYNDVVDSQILTVLAPTDEAFETFLREHGYASIDEMYGKDPVYTRQVITYHLLYYAMNWEKMTNFRPTEGDAATEEERAIKAGMYNRFRTRCAVDETVEFNSDATVNDNVRVVHYDRYLTVFSQKLFNTLGIDAEENYKFFFPNSTWNPNKLANGFNVMNAAVLDTAAVVTDNGYLYHIDQVIEPVGTIYDELAKGDNYQLAKSLFDQYGVYTQDAAESDNRGYTVYAHTFTDGLPPIASEWASNDYRGFTVNSFQSYNVFLPTDQAIRKMFSEYWADGCGYTSVETLNPLIQQILLKECVGYIELDGDRKTQYLCYPDFIRKEKAISSFGTPLTTDPKTYDNTLMCNNGVIYGSSNMAVPGVFSSVAGPAFKDIKYLPQLYVLEGAEQLLSLSSKESQFITLTPDTAQFSHNDPAMRLFRSSASGTTTYQMQQWNDEVSDYVTMGTSTMRNIANMHTSTDATELKSTGTQVIETNVSFNYWYVADGQITTNALFNEQLNPSFTGTIWAPFHEIYSTGTNAWSNGRSYAYEYPGVYQPASGTSLETELSQNNDRNYPYYCFAQLLRLSGLADKGRFTGMLTLDPESPRFFAFVPTNEAIKNNLADIPGCGKTTIDTNYKLSTSISTANKALLANYLLSYFVTADRNAFTSYPYVGSTCKGQFETSGNFGLNITDNGQAIAVQATSQRGNTAEGTPVAVVGTYNYLPFAFGDGAFQLLEGILK